MPIVNYVREHERFIEYAADEHISLSERSVWYALMHIMNQRAQGNVWPDEFIRISNDRLLSLCPIRFDTMAAARNGLKQHGLIDFLPGKKNKESPAYRMIYFYPQYIAPSSEQDGESYPKISDNIGDNVGDNIRGNIGDNKGGNIGDTYINKDNNRNGKQKQENAEEDNPTTKEDARAKVIRLYPKRERVLTPKEMGYLDIVNVWLDGSPHVRQVLGKDGMAILGAMLQSDRFPIDLVGYAVEKTIERNAKYMYPLDNPIGYTQKLLQDWEKRGFKTREDVQEAKDDWGHFA